MKRVLFAMCLSFSILGNAQAEISIVEHAAMAPKLPLDVGEFATILEEGFSVVQCWDDRCWNIVTLEELDPSQEAKDGFYLIKG